MAAGYRRANYYELCRLCTSSEGTKVHIFREEGQRKQLLTKIQICLPLQILEGDSLPNIVCADCVERLESFYDFREACINAEAMLESYYSSLKFNEEFRKTGKCYVKEAPPKKKSKHSNKLPLEPLVKPDINITRIETVAPQVVQQTSAAVEDPIPRIGSIQHVAEVQIHPVELDHGDVQQFEFVVEDDERPSEEDYKKVEEEEIEENETLLMEFDFIKDKDESVKSEDVERGSIDQIGEFLRIKPVSVTPVTNASAQSEDDETLGTLNCSRCHKTFYTNQQLNEHECGGVQVTIVPVKANSSASKLSTSDEACYLCEVCSRPFKRKEHLLQHSKLHTGERPYPCTVCNKTFARKEHLIRHTTCHTGEKMHECDVCTKSFSRRDNLLKHRKTHGATGPYVCDTCGKTFTMKHYYSLHVSTHTNEAPDRPFRCMKCGKRFALRQYLMNHLARHREMEGNADAPQNKSEDDMQNTVELPSADETVESLAEQRNNYVQIVQLTATSDDLEAVATGQDQDGNTYVQIVALKEEQS
ncbi:zinc finger protein 180-like [Neocloeon triangulifer]|uniref:zinc finger protein 180-like n=1 Tax=Neocloeon triangulifer TaxID=2078957 RepID=UPI00286F65C6|nr:zinc finger protein 180-like [Neocloeon triangulifer]